MVRDLFDQSESDDSKRDRLRALGWTERMVATRSGVPSRFWQSPDGRELAEYRAFELLPKEAPPDGADVPRP